MAVIRISNKKVALSMLITLALQLVPGAFLMAEKGTLKKSVKPKGIFGVPENALEKPQTFGNREDGLKDNYFPAPTIKEDSNKKKRGSGTKKSDSSAPLDSQHSWEEIPERKPAE